MLSSWTCSVVGAGVGGSEGEGGGDCWIGVAEQVSQVRSWVWSGYRRSGFVDMVRVSYAASN